MKYLGQANFFRYNAKARSDYAITRFLDETKRLYGVLNDRLAESEWLAGDKYTIADIAIYPWANGLRNWVKEDMDLDAFPKVKEWVEKIEQRKGVQAGLNVPPPRMSLEDRVKWLKSQRERVEAMTNEDKIS